MSAPSANLTNVRHTLKNMTNVRYTLQSFTCDRQFLMQTFETRYENLTNGRQILQKIDKCLKHSAKIDKCPKLATKLYKSATHYTKLDKCMTQYKTWQICNRFHKTCQMSGIIYKTWQCATLCKKLTNVPHAIQKWQSATHCTKLDKFWKLDNVWYTLQNLANIRFTNWVQLGYSLTLTLKQTCSLWKTEMRVFYKLDWSLTLSVWLTL